MKKISLIALLLIIPLVCCGQDTVIQASTQNERQAQGNSERFDKEMFDKEMDGLIEKYGNSNPEEDARVAFEKHDLRFISIMGYMPGLDGQFDRIKDYGRSYIPNTGDVILTEKHAKFQTIAHKYAELYNKTMLQLINNGNKEQPLQLVISSDKQEYGAGEEIKLSVCFKNISNREIIFCRYVLEYRLMKSGIEFRSQDGSVYTMTTNQQLEMPLLTKESYIPLPPNKEYALELKIPTIPKPDSGWSDEFGMPQKIPPGVYQIKLIYDNNYDFIEGRPNIHIENVWTGALTSNTATIKVTEK